MSELIPDLLDPVILLETVSQVEAIYATELRSQLEPDNNGQVIAIHLESHDYALARTDTQASRVLRKRQPKGIILTRRVGSDETDALAYKMTSATAMPK